MSDEYSRLISHVESANLIDSFKKRLNILMDDDRLQELSYLGRLTSCRLVMFFSLDSPLSISLVVVALYPNK